MQEVVEFRAQGRTWTEIATARKTLPDTIRKQFDRAINAALASLGLGEATDE